MTVTLGELAVRFGCELRGDPAATVDSVAALSQAGPRSITFLANPKYVAQLAGTRAGAVILDAKSAAQFAGAGADRRQSARHLRARRDAAASRSAAAIPASIPRRRSRRAPPSTPRREIGAQAYVGEGARIGARCFIGPGSVIERGAVIGDDSRFVARVFVGHDVVFGKRCIVQPGAVIGGDGFGFAPEKGTWIKVPQIGGVNIGDDVEIGANTTIDRGALDDTVIEEGVKLDNLIMIAHNCRIGAHSALAACVAIAGSSVVGKRCILGGRVGPDRPHHLVRRRGSARHLLHLTLHQQAGRVFFRAAERGGGHVAPDRRAHQAARFDGQAVARRGKTRRLQRRGQRFFRGLTK